MNPLELRSKIEKALDDEKGGTIVTPISPEPGRPLKLIVHTPDTYGPADTRQYTITITED